MVFWWKRAQNHLAPSEADGVVRLAESAGFPLIFLARFLTVGPRVATFTVRPARWQGDSAIGRIRPHGKSKWPQPRVGSR